MPDGAGAAGWIDSHCHLPDDAGERGALLADAAATGVVAVVTVGCDGPTSQACAAAVGAGDDVGVAVWATAGVHPHDARTAVDPGTGAVALGAIEALL
jgi:Tat protein secretion system quality control protein TatD with DNase activity